MSRILVVDNDPASCDVMAYSLKSLGYHVITAPDSERALNMSLADDIGLVIMDMRVPHHEGSEVLAMLRGTSVSVLVMTEFDAPDLRVAMFGLGIDGVLTKPVDLDVLREHVSRLLPDHSPSGGALRRRARERGLDLRPEWIHLDPRAELLRDGT